MRRRLSIAFGLVATAAAAAAASATAGGPAPQLRESVSRFPDRAFLLTLPERTRLNAGNVRVTENGEPVSDLTVTTPGSDSATMLVIDSSNSMAGAPIAGAMRAARAFAAQRSQAARLGVIFFDRETAVALAPTRNQREIQTALAKTPELDEGTHLYDALDTAVNELTGVGARVPSVVVLTDGDDVGSGTSENAALGRLKDKGIRVFSVGLRSPAYTPDTLQRLATETGGAYAVTGAAAGLTPILSALGFRLANEYLLFYRSLEGPKSNVNVAVRAPGYPVVRTSYLTPALGFVPEPVERGLVDEVLQSTAFMVFLAFFVVGLVLLGLRLVFDLRAQSLRSRMSRFVEMGEDGNLLSRDELSARLERLEQSLESRGWLEKFAEECDVAGIKRSPGSLLILSLGISAFVAVVLSVAWTGAAVLLAPAGPMLVYFWVKRQKRRQQKLFGDQLPDNLDVLAQALRVGHSLVGGLSMMADDAAEPSRREFRRVVLDEQLGILLEDAMRKVAERMESQDMEHVALVALLQRETGGASAEVIDQVSENIRGRMEVRRLVRVLTAQGRLARWIVSLMPVVLFLMIMSIYPEYLDPMVHETFGLAVLFIAGLMVLAGSYVIGRIIDIKV